MWTQSCARSRATTLGNYLIRSRFVDPVPYAHVIQSEERPTLSRTPTAHFEGVGDVLAITPTPWCPPQPDSPVTSSKILWRTFGQRGCETESARKVNDPEIFWHTIGQPGCEREYTVSGNLFW